MRPCASVAARKDLSPLFVDQWKLPLAPDTRAALGKIDWHKKGLTVKEVMGTVAPHWNK